MRSILSLCQSSRFFGVAFARSHLCNFDLTNEDGREMGLFSTNNIRGYIRETRSILRTLSVFDYFLKLV